MSTSRKAQSAPPERQAFGLRIPRASDARLRALRTAHQPAHQGWRLWSATWLLLSYLETQQLDGVDVLDVGCGWGLAGVYCARRGARVVGCDLDPEVLPIAQFHAESNDVSISTQARGFDALGADMLEGVSWVVGADICFRGDLIDPLFGLVERARAAEIRIAIADPGRPPFQTLACRCVDELDAWTGPISTLEPLVAWPGERPLVHGRLLTLGADPPQLV
ncbi:MAG: methyltransferase domain-containing protein [Candidatus Latescibacterota bacterium]|jgi:predicted nicotinamide N-methyase